MNDNEIRERMNKVLSSLEENLRKLRSGRANTGIIETVKADAYGSAMPLNQLANISVLDFKTILVQPWDKANVDNIVKSISASNIGLTPVKDGDIVRVSVPELTEERRRELVKVVGTYEEESKVGLRQVRKDAIESYRRDKTSTEDDIRHITDKVDKIIKEYNNKVAEICDGKRAEMMQI